MDIVDSPQRLVELKEKLNISDSSLKEKLTFAEKVSLRFKEAWSLSEFAIALEDSKVKNLRAKHRSLFYGSGAFQMLPQEKYKSY